MGLDSRDAEELQQELTRLRAELARLRAEAAAREEREAGGAPRDCFSLFTEPAVYKDADLVIREANHAFLRMVGRHAPEVLGRRDQDLFPAEEAGVFAQEDQLSLASGQPREAETHLTGLTGSRWVVVCRRPLPPRPGRPVGLIITWRDITARKVAEERRRESDEISRRLFQGARDAMVVADAADGRLLNANQAFLKLYGYQLSDLSGHTLADLEAPGGANGLDSPPATYSQRVLRRLHHKKGGELFPVEVSFTTFLRGGREAVLTVIRDLTEAEVMDQALLESQERFRAFFEQAAVGMALANLSGEFLLVNHRLEEILGHRPGTLAGRPVRGLLEAPETDKLARGVSRLVAGEMSRFYLETSFLHTAGQRQWAKLTVSLGRDHEHRPAYYIAVVEDVTSRKVAEEALMESERRYRDLFEDHQAIKLLVDQDSGAVVDANPAACEFYGYSHPELTRLHLADLNGLGPAEYREAMEEARRLGKKCVEEQHRLAGGDIRWMESHTGVVTVEGRTAWYAILHDITARRAMEEALAEHMNFQRTLIDTIPNPVFFTDRAGRYLGCNRNFEAFLGVRQEQLLGRTPAEVGPAELAKVQQDTVRLLEETGAAPAGWRFEARCQRQDRQPRQLIVHLAAFTDAAGQPAGLVGTLVDITEQRAAREKLQYQNTLLTAQKETSPDGILVLDSRGRMQDCNQRFLEMWGWADQGAACPPPEDMAPALLGRLVDPRAARQLLLHPDGTGPGAESRLQLHLGDNRVFEQYSRPVGDAQSGRWGRVFFFRDLTQRVQMDAELRQAISLLQVVVDTMPAHISLVDPQFTVLDLNRRRLEALDNPDKSQAVGRKCHELYQHRDTPCPNCLVLQALDQGQMVTRVNDPGDELHFGHPVQFYAVPIKAPSGQVTAVVAIAVDISQLRRAEEERIYRERLQAAIETAGAACHELNQPLQAILGLAEMAFLRLEPGSRAQADLEKIIVQTQRMGEITGRLRNITSFHTKRYVGNTHILDLDSSTD
ncbi:MAG: PAS domain S-box protein [Deltaproteobacteria bacterium]|nr:PAS domain S-box protein [Deltaproteobacteria bacterium]